MVESHPLYYQEQHFFVTSKGNKISRQVLIKGTERILIDGNTIMQPHCVVRGDLAQISMGYYCIIKDECIIRPSYTKHQGRLKYTKMQIGDCVFIDRDCVVCALKIGNNVQIGKGCIIGHRAQIHDNSKILDNSILPPDTVVPPNTVYGGRPAQFIAELPESIGIVHREFCTNYYNSFVEYRGSTAPQ